MQLVLSNNRVIAHGENFIAMGSVVINTVTGKKYENATVAECDNCPSDINETGYEYHAGVFKPCAPYGKGNNNGCFMEICVDCATPRSSGIPIKGGLKLKNLHSEVLAGFNNEVLWENASPTSEFARQTLELDLTKYARIKVEMVDGAVQELLFKNEQYVLLFGEYWRKCKFTDIGVEFENAYVFGYETTQYNGHCIPYKIIGYERL
jgi:hypothetical protein